MRVSMAAASPSGTRTPSVAARFSGVGNYRASCAPPGLLDEAGAHEVDVELGVPGSAGTHA